MPDDTKLKNSLAAAASMSAPTPPRRPAIGNVAAALDPKGHVQGLKPAAIQDTFDYDVAVHFGIIGSGQGGSRIAQSFWDLGYRRVAAFNTTPAKPYDIAIFDAGQRFGGDATYLAEDLDLTETAVDVVAGETWATTASHPTAFPGNVLIDGVTYECTAITGAAPNYQLTITRLAEDKTHDAGSPVTVADVGHFGM